MIEADFRALPLAASAQAAIEAAQALGAGHVDVRISRQRTRSASVRDARPLAVVADSVTGMGVRVLVDGVWGFAAGDLVDPGGRGRGRRAGRRDGPGGHPGGP